MSLPEPPGHACPQVTGAAVPWHAIPGMALVDAVSGERPALETTVRMAWTSEAWMLRFECVDPEPWGTMTRRDDPIYDEEVVEVFVDPWGDLEAYYEIEVSPLNTVCDLVLRRSTSGWKKDFAWDCAGLATSVETVDGGWVATLSIPFRGLVPEPVAAGRVWRANFFRIDRPGRAGMDLSAWSPTGVPRFHVQERFGRIRFAGSTEKEETVR